MADQKISDLTALVGASVDAADLLVVVDTSATQTKKILFSELVAAVIPAGSISYAEIQDVSATQRVLGRNTAGAGDVEEVTLSQLLDWVGSAAQGDLLYRGASGWVRLAAGTAQTVLKTGGAGGNPSWGGKSRIDAHWGDIPVAADGATVTFDLDQADFQKVVLGGNRNIAVSNGTDGQRFFLALGQDGTGSRTVASWFSGIKWAGGSPPTLTTAPNKYDLFSFVRISSTEYWGFVVGQNI